MNKDNSLIGIRNVYILIFLGLVGWMAFAYLTMDEHIIHQKIYAELINKSGKQRMLSQKTALFSARVYHNGETDLAEHRNELITEMKADHEYILSHLTSDTMERIYLASPHQLDNDVRHYLELLNQPPSGDIPTYLHKIFHASSALLPKLDYAVGAFQDESEAMTRSLRDRERFILIGSLITLSLEYLFVYLPTFRRMQSNEAKLVQAKDTFKQLVKLSPDGTQIISLDGRIQMISDVAAEMLGYSNDEMHQLKILDWDAELTSHQLASLINSFSTDKTTLFETKHRRKDGTVYDALISARLVKINGESLIYATVKDVTSLNEEKRRHEIDLLKLRVATKPANMGIWQWNPATDELVWDRKMNQIFDVEQPLNFEQWQEVIIDEDRERAVSELKNALENKTSFQSTFSIRLSNGSKRTIHASAKPFFDDHGDIEFLVGTNRDITTEQDYLEKINRLNWQLNQAQGIVKLGYWELNHYNGELYWSDNIFSIFGLDKTQFKPSYRSFLDTIHPEDRMLVNNAFTQSLQQHKPYDITHRLRMNDGAVKYVHQMGETAYDNAGVPVRTLRTIQDITEKRRSEVERERYIDLIEHNIITSTTDLEGVITDVSQAFSDITGFSKQEVIGNKHSLFSHPDTPPSYYHSLWEALNRGQSWQGEMKNQSKDGNTYWLKVTISPVFDHMNRKIGYSEIGQDITDKKRAEELAITDQLTGLYNRLHIDRVAKIEIEREKRYGNDLSLLMMDLDHFKNVNDTYGHMAGDEVLIHLANILREHTRAADCVGRWGGEEFIIICPDTNLHSATVLAEKLRTTIEAHSFPAVGRLTSCFGVAQYQESDTGKEQMITRADEALYKAKEQGRNRVVAE
ncbi:diguanylate cyclase [Vibrio fluvialis]|nr:diguanylate cyclase [Vibrio cholerae]ELJ8601463.1 diguanylate cyclase [Vibrio cholerae]MBY8148840.1 diguanylate cyclase [Vibrio fluvialis]MBY8182339.1 diguanylate cyclase [Vibrio fluvialis]